MTDARELRGQRLLAALALAIAALAGWAAWRTATAGADEPSQAQWRRLAERVRAAHRAGDLVTFAPPWLDPIGRMHLGELLSLDDLGRADAARYPRVWVVSVRGADSPEVAGEVAAETWREGELTARRYDRTAAMILDDTLRSLPNARPSGEAVRGPELVLAEIGFTPRRCIQVVPRAGGEARLAFPSFTLGRELWVFGGLADIFTRRDVREPGELEVWLGGRRAGALRLGIDEGWRSLRLATEPGTTELVVVARAPSPRARDRQVCFTVESRK